MADRGFDPYRILGVPPTATTLEIARARRRLAKQLHPDLGGTDAAADRMRLVNRAWHVLSDPERRRAWDRSTAAAAPGSPSAEGQWPAERRTTSWTAWSAEEPPRAVRRAKQPTGPVSVRDSGWLALAIAGLLVVGLLGAGWLAATQSAMTLDEAIAEQGVDPATTVALDASTVIAARWTEDRVGEVIGRLTLLRFRRIGEGWDTVGATTTVVTVAPTVAIITGRSASTWPTFVFGYAPEGVARVTLPELDGIGGEVVDGTWAIGTRTADVEPRDVAWQLVGEDGAVVAEGRGPLHCPGC